MSNFQKVLNIVVTGEVDSGKSTLIGRFLYESGVLSQGVTEEIADVCQKLKDSFEFAYLLDSLEEERSNQLTLDTTQVFCKIKKGKEFVFIDVPGHQELLKNMLCGSSYADIAILVIDVQKSIEQQTKRHALILKFLKIQQIIIVLNKMDLIDFNKIIFRKVKQEICKFFKKIDLQPKYCIPTSAKQGDNLLKRSKKMVWYRGPSLNKALNACCKKEIDGAFCFPIQDIYNINEEKIAVGKIISGEIKKGEKVKILPMNKACQVKTIKVFNKKTLVAKVPQSIGLILNDMASLNRGQIICKPRLPQINREILCKLFCVYPLKINEPINFRCITQESCAQIKQIKGIWDSGSLEPKTKGDLENNDIAEVIIFTEKPIVIESFKGFNALGRFVLQRNREICAVGIIP